MDLYIFDNAYTGSGVNFDFQGCHMFSNVTILLIYGNPDLKFIKYLNFSLIIHTSTYNCKEDRQNAQEIPMAGCSKLMICLFDASYFEIISLRPREIWQP